jgi:YggT family protein
LKEENQVGQILLTTVNLLFPLLMLIIFARVILSWLPQYRYSQIGQIIFDLSEPIMRPFQNLIPPVGMLDLSPMVAWLVLYIVWQVLDAIILSIFPM